MWLIACAACARGGTGSPDARPDGADCAAQTYYRDADGDAHGDPASPVEACEPPADAVTTNDDCDDGNAQRHPGREEICDALDNDCNAATTELCPAGCTPQRRPPPDHELHVYLVCVNPASWTNARSICAGATYRLVRIEDAGENAYVRAAANAAFGTADLHIGGTDATAEGAWAWDGGDPFWQGNAGGAPVGGRYANWEGGEPNNNDDEDCAEMRAAGGWNDSECGDSQRFICRR